jgi:hypothetical protein
MRSARRRGGQEHRGKRFFQQPVRGAGLDAISIIREGHGVVKRKTTEKAQFLALFLHAPR